VSSDVIVPEVGELGMEVTFVRWLRVAGERVAPGDPLFELDTEKSVMVVEAYAEGVLADLAVREGDTVAPRQVIGRIVSEGDGRAGSPTTHPASPAPPTQPGGPPAAAASSAASAARPGASPSPAEARQTARAERAGVSPRARRVAAQLDVDLAAVAGSGPEGLITEADVRAAAEGARMADPGPLVSGTSGQAARTRRAIAELTSDSWRTIPHFYLQLEADVERALHVARPTPLVCAAVAQALVRHPDCNLRWDGDVPTRRDTVEVGLLVDSPHGLLITVIRDAQDLDLADMADAVRDAAARGRSGKLSAADVGPRSVTVSNLGMFAVDRFAAVIPAPDILTLAVGRARVLPRWDGSTFQPTRIMDLTLSVDHRALDGVAAARLLSELEGILADPVTAGLT
jgi:pyruvate dehydrogenase E2 component (dihydrolipoamide acetyltransferase)